MAARNVKRPKAFSGAKGSIDPQAFPNFNDLLGRFSDALAVVETATRALETGTELGAEVSALRTGLNLLQTLYGAFDAATRQVS